MIKPNMFVQEVHLFGHKNMFNSELCQQFLYEKHGISTLCLVGELEMPALLDNKCGLSIQTE